MAKTPSRRPTSRRTGKAGTPKTPSPAAATGPSPSPPASPTGAQVEILAPLAGSLLHSPLAIAAVRFRDVAPPVAILHVGQVRHVLALPTPTGEVRENITLLLGENRIRVEAGGAVHEVRVVLAPSDKLTIEAPALAEGQDDGAAVVETRATDVTGAYTGASCPAGVIAVNGFMQQFSVEKAEGRFAEKVVLGAGDNHLAVQIGELYATRLVRATFPPARIIATLVWDTPGTDLDLYVTEPSGHTVWYKNKHVPDGGTLDVDRREGFGPENYSLGRAGEPVPPGEYGVRVHYFADRGLGRSEWTVRIITDEGTAHQKRQTFYGILDQASGANQDPGGVGPDWDEVCTVTAGTDGGLTLAARGVPTYYGSRVTSRRVAFIVDVSGSMGAQVVNDKGESVGTRLEICQRELGNVIKMLPDDAQFNLSAFHTTYRSCAERLFAADAAGKERALAFVNSLRPDEYTNLYDPLEAVLRDPAVDTIYLLSDGEPNKGQHTNERAILEAVRRENAARNATIHTISVGQRSTLMQRLAEQNRGQYLVR